jgi:hypothetical protein
VAPGPRNGTPLQSITAWGSAASVEIVRPRFASPPGLCSPPGGGIQKDLFRTDPLGQIVCSSQTNGYATKDQAWANYAYRRLRTSISCPSNVQYPHRSSPIRPHAAITPVLVQPIANEESTNSLSVPLRLVSWNRSSSTPSGSSGSCLK